MCKNNNHDDWKYCYPNDTYYCTVCKVEVTKNELFHIWRENELIQSCLNRVAIEKGLYCGR